MNYWQASQELRQEAWRYLADEIEPDVALLQEAVPSGSEGVDRVYRAGGIDERRRWGSAVVSYGPELEELTTQRNRVTGTRQLDLLQTRPGTVVVAEARPPDAEPVVVISVYGLI